MKLKKVLLLLLVFLLTGCSATYNVTLKANSSVQENAEIKINDTEDNYSRILKVTSPLMYGEDVRAVQNKLNSLGYNAGTADGYYGEGTRTAVINFQTARGLDIDGEVGPNTWNTLFNTSSSGGNGVTSNIRKVFIDPGHGGTDPGASGNGLYEKEVVLSIAKKVGNILIPLPPLKEQQRIVAQIEKLFEQLH